MVWPKAISLLALLPILAFAQSPGQLRDLVAPRLLALSSDGSRLFYKLGQNWWEVETGRNPRPKRAGRHPAQEPTTPAVQGTRRLSRESPDGKRVAYLDAQRLFGPALLFCCGSPQPDPLSPMPILDFRWASDSNSLWVIAAAGPDETIGRLYLDGRFQPRSQGEAMRRTGGLAAAGDVVAWVQSDPSHFGTIWVLDKTGASRILVEPNPQAANWNPGTQESVRWQNTHKENLHGILVKPAGSGPFPLLIDPYSSWRNRFLNIAVLGNYSFVKEGFAVFFPNHRAPHTFPQIAFGDAYVGGSRDRDPLDVLTDDVMTGIGELVRRGIADADPLFLYSSSNGASAINQLLTQTRAFRAAVSHAGVSDWLGYYRSRRPLGDETIPGFLGGRKPEDSPELYRRISPLFQADKITTPLLLIIGDKDSRYEDTLKFYEALRNAGSPVRLTVYPGAGHEIQDAALAGQHVRQALEFFRAAPVVSR